MFKFVKKSMTLYEQFRGAGCKLECPDNPVDAGFVFMMIRCVKLSHKQSNSLYEPASTNTELTNAVVQTCYVCSSDQICYSCKV